MYIYWTDYQYQRIEMARFDGSDRRVLFEEEISHPRGIAVDPSEGFVFWTDWGPDPKIERSSLSGEDRKTLFSASSQKIQWPNGITTDYVGKRIYWVDAKHDIIVSSDYHGNNKNSLLIKNLNIHPFSVAFFRNTLYWSDWNISPRTVVRTNMINPPYQTGTFGNLSLDKVTGIAVFHSSIQPAVQTSCHSNNGGCSHLCLLKPNGYKCACPNGVSLQRDGRTCNKGFDRFLVLVDSLSQKLMQLPLDVTPSYQESIPLAVEPTVPAAIDYDPTDDVVYWSDPREKSISRASLQGTNQRQIISGVHSEGIAVDFVGRNLYWTSTSPTGGTIEVATLEGGYKKTLHRTNIPRAILVDCSSGSLFWSDWGNSPKIETSSMDGSGRAVLVDRNLVWPNGLALDSSDRKLYWVDGKRNVLELIDLDSSRRFTLVSSNTVLIQPYDLALDNKYLYWTEWNTSSVFRANKINGQNVKKILTGLKKPMGIQAFDKTNAIPDNPCLRNNGFCTHLCLLKPGGHQCACPDLQTPGKTCHTLPVYPTTATVPATVSSTRSPVPTKWISPTPPACASDPCENSGTCSNENNGFKCQCAEYYITSTCHLYIGDSIIEVTIQSQLAKFNATIFKESLVNGLNEYCRERDCPLARETSRSGPLIHELEFYARDIVVVKTTKRNGNSRIIIEFALLIPASRNTRAQNVLPRDLLAALLNNLTQFYGQELGDFKVLLIDGKQPQYLGEHRPTSSQKQKGPSELTIVAGAIPAVLLLSAIIIGVIWYHRRQVNSTFEKGEGSVHFSRTGELEQSRSFSNPGFEVLDNQANYRMNAIQNRNLPSLPLERLPGQYPVIDRIPQIPSSVNGGAAAKQYDIPALIEDEKRSTVVEAPPQNLKPESHKKTSRYVDPPYIAGGTALVTRGVKGVLEPSNNLESDSKYAALKRKPGADDSKGSTYAKLDARTRESTGPEGMYIPVLNSQEEDRNVDNRVYDDFIPSLEISDELKSPDYLNAP